MLDFVFFLIFSPDDDLSTAVFSMNLDLLEERPSNRRTNGYIHKRNWKHLADAFSVDAETFILRFCTTASCKVRLAREELD